MKTIWLTQGQVTIVDDEDYAHLQQFRWRARLSHLRWYAVRSFRVDGCWKEVGMHRVILGLSLCGGSIQVDHKNGDGLDNRRANLRRATGNQNRWNVARLRNNTSGFKGVVRHREKWQASIRVYGKRIYLGCYPTPELAAQAYNRAAAEHFSEFAFTNEVRGVGLSQKASA